MNWRALSWGYWKSWGIFLGDSGDWNIGASNFPLNLAKLAEYNPFDPTQSPSSCWHKYSLCWHNYSTNSACVCVCPICVFFGDSQWEKDHDSTSTCCTCSRDPIQSCSHQRSPESPVTSRYIEVRQQIAECLGICLLPDGGLEENYWKGWGQWKPTKPLDYGCLKLLIFSCEAKWLLQILECLWMLRIALGIQVR